MHSLARYQCLVSKKLRLMPHSKTALRAVFLVSLSSKVLIDSQILARKPGVEVDFSGHVICGSFRLCWNRPFHIIHLTNRHALPHSQKLFAWDQRSVLWLLGGISAVISVGVLACSALGALCTLPVAAVCQDPASLTFASMPHRGPGYFLWEVSTPNTWQHICTVLLWPQRIIDWRTPMATVSASAHVLSAQRSGKWSQSARARLHTWVQIAWDHMSRSSRF